MTSAAAPPGMGRTRRLEQVLQQVRALRNAAVAAETEFGADLDAIAPAYRESARNLVHYVAVRRHDIRPLQDELAKLGLSSLGRIESHVLATLDAVLDALVALAGAPRRSATAGRDAIGFETGSALLAAHAAAALGPPHPECGARIMVTMPGEAADDPALIRGLVESGMSIMRVNCAHDDPAVWSRMVRHLRRAERDAKRRCLVSFDLGGPKLRTGPIAAGPPVVKWRPERDVLGRVIAPALVTLTGAEAAEASVRGRPAVPVSGPLLHKARVHDVVTFDDSRGRRRELKVAATKHGSCVCEAEATAYVTPGTRLELRRGRRIVARGEVAELPATERYIELRRGDLLEVRRGEAPGEDALHHDDGRVLVPAHVSCALDAVFTGVRVGEPILFDDGRIRGVIRSVGEDSLLVEIAGVAGDAAKLRAEKGINLPESQLALPALTAADREHLRAVSGWADLVALSFVQRPDDVAALLDVVSALDRPELGIVLKIETRAAFDSLPALLLAAMRRPRVAVMVARGDLAVEVGFERLSEVQEEILWMCEAAHIPVIWATQVLESLAKGGTPSRAEVTDAAMAGRAECVMLNKGPYIVETMRFLVGVLKRMQEHQYKKTARLRKLGISAAGAAPGSRRRREPMPTAAP